MAVCLSSYVDLETWRHLWFLLNSFFSCFHQTFLILSKVSAWGGGLAFSFDLEKYVKNITKQKLHQKKKKKAFYFTDERNQTSVITVVFFFFLFTKLSAAPPHSPRTAGVFLLTEGGRYTFTLAAARAACLQLNATIASRAQVERALQRGLETCK